MESRLFSDPKDGPKTSRAFPTGKEPMLIGMKEKGKGDGQEMGHYGIL